jgi:predicted secreted Zn-dependent protease
MFLANPGVSLSSEPPGIHTERKLEYYELSGATRVELKASLDERHARGIDWAGRTETSMNWNVPADGRGGCRLEDATIDLTLTVIMPRLAPGTRLSAPDEQYWRQLESTLAAHEEEHVQIAMDGAQRILGAIHNSSCGSWKSDAAREAGALKDRQKAYDRTSDHGRQQANYVRQASPDDGLNGVPVEWTVQAQE